jgi:hypothetical protein
MKLGLELQTILDHFYEKIPDGEAANGQNRG